MMSRLTNVQRVYILVAIALLLPAIVLLALSAYDAYSNVVRATRDDATDSANDLLMLADARAMSDMGVLRVLSGSRAFRDLDFEGGRDRALEVLDLLDGWKAIVMTERETGAIVFQASRQPQPSSRIEVNTLPGDLSRGVFGGVQRDGAYCPCVQLAIDIPGQDGYTLTAFIDPGVYQRLVHAGLPANSVAAVVDREGKFLARSLDYLDRVGTPGTSYVLAAVEKGGQGIYEGRTFEGLVNYTAYATSEVTGWSSHVAIDNALVDAPMRRANIILVGGALAAVAGAVLLLLVSLRDIAIRRRDAQRLIELQRAEAISHFTATVIHDFRNIVSTIMSGLRLIQRKTGNDEIKAHVAMIETSVEKGSRLANQLLSFSNAEHAETAPVAVRRLLQEMEYMIVQAVGPKIALTLDLPEEDLCVTANRDQLELALLNLAVNARDAMHGEGRLTVGVREEDRTVQLRVSDTGPGVPRDRRQAIFRAFETDKPNGTGLGLSQVEGMARQAGGQVSVEDAEGGGACFVVTLPRATNVLEVSFGVPA